MPSVIKSEWQFKFEIVIDLFAEKKEKGTIKGSRIELNAASANIVNEIYRKWLERCRSKEETKKTRIYKKRSQMKKDILF